jgi:hypothetical protein
MAYIPKSKIKTSTTLGGEFITKAEKNNYKGDYFETSAGLYYVGHNNLDLSKELIRVKIDKSAVKPITTEKNVVKYNVYKKDIEKFLSQTITPPTNKEKPTDKDYKRGYFTRYFCKKVNDNNYIEINKDTFLKLYSKDKIHDFNLYVPGKITWHLIGNVYKLNTMVISRNARNFPNISYLFPILNEYFKPTILIQENLHTQGNELYYSNGNMYVGEYHIHPTIGPMVGSLHTGVEHKKLYYTNQLPKPNGMGYEEWLASQPLPTYLGNKKKKRYLSFHDSKYFTPKFSNDYALGQIIYKENVSSFYQAYENVTIQPNNPTYYTFRFTNHMTNDFLHFDPIRKKYYYYPLNVKEESIGSTEVKSRDLDSSSRSSGTTNSGDRSTGNTNSGTSLYQRT